MPGHRVPIIFKGGDDWAYRFQNDLEKQLPSGFTLQRREPQTVRADEDVIIVCPSYSRLEADFDLALQGINVAHHAVRKIVVLYIHNVTERQLSGLHTQRDVEADLAHKYSGIHVLDIGVNANMLYRCQRNDDSIKILSGILKPKDDSSTWSMKSMIPSFFGSSKSKTPERPCPVAKTGVGSSVESTTRPPPAAAYKSPLLTKPWRDEIQWGEVHCCGLQEQIQQMIKPEILQPTNIVVLGERESGKKSFGHFVAEVLNSPFVNTGKDCWFVNNEQNNFRVVGAEGLLQDPINEWMQAKFSTTKVDPTYSAKRSNGASTNGTFRTDTVSSPDNALRANPVPCVVFVASARNIRVQSHAAAPGGRMDDIQKLDPALQRHLDDIQKRGINRILLLTHTEVCPEVEKQTKHMYLSRRMKTIIERAAELYQMPVSHVHAVKSYSMRSPEISGHQVQDSESLAKRILLLRALITVVNFTYDYFEPR